MAARAVLAAAAAAAASAPTPVIDAHVHIISPSLNYTWFAAPAAPLACPCVFPSGLPCGCAWGYADYAAASATLPATKFVFVEVAAQPAQWLAEAQWVQSLAPGVPVGGIVAGAPPGFGVPGADARAVAAALDALAALPLARGIRGSGLNWTDATAFGTHVSHAALLAARGLSLDVITSVAENGAAVAALARAVPGLTVVLDHVGSPAAKDPAAFAGWARGVAAAAAAPNVVVKLGGILQYFKDDSGVLPSAAETAPFVAAAAKAFGWDRVLFEGNWFFANWPGRMDVFEAWVCVRRRGRRARRAQAHSPPAPLAARCSTPPSTRSRRRPRSAPRSSPATPRALIASRCEAHSLRGAAPADAPRRRRRRRRPHRKFGRRRALTHPPPHAAALARFTTAARENPARRGGPPIARDERAARVLLLRG